jgi:hypothetical protein
LFSLSSELDQSGALLQALGAGVPRSHTTSAGIADPIRQFGAGRVAHPGDIDALAAAAQELLDDAAALEAPGGSPPRAARC